MGGASSRKHGHDRTPRRAAFTLVELLIVIAIIAVVVALLFPAFRGARDAARALETRQMMASINSAAARFQTDERRMPGYFSVREMGASSNATRGMSGMENIMLDLAGKAAIVPQGTPNSVLVGPGSTQSSQISVLPELIGAGDGRTKNYLELNKKMLRAQVAGSKQLGQAGHTDVDGAPQLPDVVDLWGQPILAWMADDTMNEKITQPAQFARANSDGNRALFYWNQNACFLGVDALGQRAGKQRDESYLGGDPANPTPEAIESLVGVLGDPNAPYRNPNDPAFAPLVAVRPRALLTLHSAGRDAVFFSTKDEIGASQFATRKIDYQMSFVVRPGGTMPNASGVNDGHVDKDGKPTTVDIAQRFDDVLDFGGN